MVPNQSVFMVGLAFRSPDSTSFSLEIKKLLRILFVLSYYASLGALCLSLTILRGLLPRVLCATALADGMSFEL